MTLDILTIAFVTSLAFVTQAAALAMQYRVKTAYRGVGHWLVGTSLLAFGFVAMLTLAVDGIRVLAAFANPAIVLGLLFLNEGVARFCGDEGPRRFSAAWFFAFLVAYLAFLVPLESVAGRSVVVYAATAAPALLVWKRLWFRRDPAFRDSARFTASVFLAYGLFQAAMIVATFVSPPPAVYFSEDPSALRVVSFLVPMFVGSLWTLGFIVMLNQRLNDENFRKNRRLETILREVHHRMKNNMNMMISLLRLQADELRDPTAVAALEDAERRMLGMALLYDRLSKSDDFVDAPAGEYLSSLVDEIVANVPSGGVRISVTKELGDFALEAKRLQPIGIIVNELVTNALKHAFADRPAGTIRVAASLDGGVVEVSVADDGVGMPNGAEDSNGFGIMLVEELSKQLRGTLTFERSAGTTARLRFPF